MKIKFARVGRLSITAAVFLFGVEIMGCSQIKSSLQPPNSPPTITTSPLSDKQQGALLQQQGVIAQQDYLRLASIQNGINQAQKVSDKDVSFLVQQLHSLPVKTSSPQKLQAENLVLGHTVGSKPKKLTPGQQRRLFDAVVPYTNSPDQWVQVSASLALASTRDLRAVPVLTRMEQSSPYPVVRLDAREWLKRLRDIQATGSEQHR